MCQDNFSRLETGLLTDTATLEKLQKQFREEVHEGVSYVLHNMDFSTPCPERAFPTGSFAVSL